ncbi:hypothetical protein HSX37_15545|uniref:Phage ABA sandwich domain-containing protein n=1 Tax=Dendrosporobacter quercicolus TaxID=146817 RepID=A0A1G9S8E5_9FIRM|nr:hypothetical protein [Dendrosporobacter quercicolus]NSL49448.1 hypothetical protein [Dendrosporobacter quercicolus DSM 1736]SDM31055.1 hypothetical protein SAMN04488502_103225 [Dendrosporobacter quercicolus]
MSNHEILSMQPGRDLDVKLALDVMGYLWITHWLQFSAELAVKWLGTQQELAEAGGVFKAVKPEDFQALKYRENFAESVPAYSTAADESAKITAKMAELGFQYSTETTVASGNTVYIVGFSKSGKTAATARAATLPEAVAKAALLAVA